MHDRVRDLPLNMQQKKGQPGFNSPVVHTLSSSAVISFKAGTSLAASTTKVPFFMSSLAKGIMPAVQHQTLLQHTVLHRISLDVSRIIDSLCHLEDVLHQEDVTPTCWCSRECMYDLYTLSCPASVGGDSETRQPVCCCAERKPVQANVLLLVR